MEHLSYKHKVTIMIAIMMSMFFASINQTIVGVALPRIIAKLNGMDYYTWIMTIYLLTSTISTILVGKLSDIYGRKYFILGGIVIFMVGAFLSGTAQSIINLITYRGVQGVGAGIIMATAFTAVGDLFSPRDRGRWLGIMSAVFAVSSILGPGLGGYIVDYLDWHWVFWIFLPLGFVAFFMILFLFPQVEHRKSESIDYLGSLFLTLTLVPLLLAFSWAGTKYTWSSYTILSLFAASLVSLTIFLYIETKVKSPVLPLSLFKSQMVSISNIVAFMISVGMFGALMYMPLYVQGVLGVSATYAGYVTMPMSISMFIMNSYTGNHITKTGKYKKTALLGLFIMTIGMLLMTIMDSIPTAVFSMIVFGAGLGLSLPVFIIAIQNAVDSKDLGVATSSMQLFRNLGGTIGIAVMGTILSTSIRTEMTASELTSNIDPEMAKNLAQFQNPQILLDPSKLASIQSSLPESLQTVFSQMIDSLRAALDASLSNVFLTGAIVLLLAFMLTFFLKEVPLRTTVRKIEEIKPKDQKESPSDIVPSVTK